MSLLAKIRQDVSGAASAAGVKLAAKAAEHAGVPVIELPRSTAKHPIPRPSREELLLPDPPWWLSLVVHPGDPMHPPADAQDAAAASLAASSLAEPAAAGNQPPQPADPQPPVPAMPCVHCGSPFWWQDLAGAFHCCQCLAIPSRRMLRGLWQVIWAVPPGHTRPRACWARWRPQHWNPFEHLEAAEREAAMREASKDEGF